MRRTFFTLVILLSAMSVAGILAAEDRATGNGLELEVKNHDGCPVEILEKKSRVRASFDRNPWGAGQGEDRARSADDLQTVFHVGFRNRSDQDVIAIAFLWEGFSADGRKAYEWAHTDAGEPLEPGRARVAHEQDLRPTADVIKYQLLVYQVNLADGTVWTSERVRGAAVE